MVNCPICDKQMNYINNSHLKKHGLTPSEFKKEYPNVDKISDRSRKLMGVKNNLGIVAYLQKNKQKINKEKEEYLLSPKHCKFCQSIINFTKKKNTFCSQSCAASFNNKGRIQKYSSTALENLINSGKKNFKFIENQAHRNKAVYYDLICTICEKKFTKKSKGKNNKTCSKECRRKAHSLYNYKQTKTFGICGYYKGIYCASSWELAFLISNLDAGKKVIRCDVIIPYEYKGKSHNYFPDFMIENIIYEIKGFEDEDVKFKINATIANGYEIRVLRKKEIIPIIKELKKRYDIKDITVLYDQKEKNDIRNI